jgi:hypothetical protein
MPQPISAPTMPPVRARRAAPAIAAGERAGDDEAEAGQGDRRADRGDRRGDRAEAAADRAADARAFGGLGAELGLAAVGGGREVALPRVVGHDDVDVLAAVAAVGDRLVGALGAVAVAEQSGEDALVGRASAAFHRAAPQGGEKPQGWPKPGLGAQAARVCARGASGGSYRRRCRPVARAKRRTSGTVSIRQAEAPSAIGSIEPVACMRPAPSSSAP